MSANESHSNPEKKMLHGRIEFNEKQEDHLEHSTDAQHARESTKDDKSRALDLNKNKHSGSAGGIGESIQIVVQDECGQEQVVASRNRQITEKDIERSEALKKSISRDELRIYAGNGDIGAAKFLERMTNAKSSEDIQNVQKEVDKWFGRGEYTPDQNKNIALQDQILKAIIKNEIDDLKRSVGVVHGTANFIVNTLAGVGNAVRMASAASFETSAIGLICPDLYPDKDAQVMLHKTLNGVGAAGRVLAQLNTTFNPTSPLFGIEYDPEGARMTRSVVEKLPTIVGQELHKFAQADPEAQSAIATEAILNIVTLVETGSAGAAAKVGEVSHISNFAKVAEETAALSEVAAAVKVANRGEKLTPLATVAETSEKVVAQQAEVVTALAEAKPSLRPLAEKLNECKAAINEPRYGEVGYEEKLAGGKNPKDRNFDELDEMGEKPEEVLRAITGDPPWQQDARDIAFTNRRLERGRAEYVKSDQGFVRLRRIGPGDEPRPQYSWECIGEVFSPEVRRQTDHYSCVDAVTAKLSNGQFSESQLIEKFGAPAPMKETAHLIGRKFGSIYEHEYDSKILEYCSNGPWGAKFFDGDWHAVIVAFKNEATGRLRIHDPFEGTKYEMTLQEFKRVWTGESNHL